MPFCEADCTLILMVRMERVDILNMIINSIKTGVVFCVALVCISPAGVQCLSAQERDTIVPSGIAAGDTIPGGSITGNTVIEPGDVLEIVILGEEGLSRTLMVMRSGNISFPLIGDIRVAGLTSGQATELLAQSLKKYFTHPIISVIFKSPSTPHVSVFGEVMRPGALEYQRGLRITDYIALAGGSRPNGNLKRVKVVRFEQERSSVEEIDVSEIIRNGQSDKNHFLKSGDWLYVPYRAVLSWGMVIQTVTLIATLVNLLIVLNR